VTAAETRRSVCDDPHVRSLSLHTSDGQRLAADVAEAEAEAPIGGVVLCHPQPMYGGNRFNIVVDALFSALPPAGFTTLRFDFRSAHDGGIGERLDVRAALDALAGDGVPLFVVGYSFGAVVALTTNDPRTAGIVAVAPPLTPDVPAPTVPCLMLTPDHDQYCPPERASAIAGGWTGVEIEVVESADHFLAGRTAAVAQRSVAWLSGRLASSA